MATLPRQTRQRAAIESVLGASERPLIPLEILAIAQRELPTMGIATVYRALRDGQEAGTIQAVEVAGGTTHYERADHAHHHHFHCVACGKVYEVHGCPGNLAGLAPAGFQVEGHEITLRGRCAACLGPPRVV
jgi:Fur family ferric uptake transcriptional regulator